MTKIMKKLSLTRSGGNDNFQTKRKAEKMRYKIKTFGELKEGDFFWAGIDRKIFRAGDEEIKRKKLFGGGECWADGKPGLENLNSRPRDYEVWVESRFNYPLVIGLLVGALIMIAIVAWFVRWAVR
jgi:hypothetical protein